MHLRDGRGVARIMMRDHSGAAEGKSRSARGRGCWARHLRRWVVGKIVGAWRLVLLVPPPEEAGDEKGKSQKAGADADADYGRRGKALFLLLFGGAGTGIVQVWVVACVGPVGSVVGGEPGRVDEEG